MRETDSQRPLNLLARGMLQVRDTIPPKPVVLYYIGVDTVQGVPVHTVRWKLSVRRDARGNYTLLDTAALRVARNGYFAVEAEEKKNGTDNPMGVYAFDVTYDGKPGFSWSSIRDRVRRGALLLRGGALSAVPRYAQRGLPALQIAEQPPAGVP